MPCVTQAPSSQLAGNFVKNTRRAAVYISAADIHVSMSADPVSVISH